MLKTSILTKTSWYSKWFDQSKPQLSYNIEIVNRQDTRFSRLGLGLWCLTPLSVYGQFYRWRNPEYPKKTTDLSQDLVSLLSWFFRWKYDPHENTYNFWQMIMWILTSFDKVFSCGSLQWHMLSKSSFSNSKTASITCATAINIGVASLSYNTVPSCQNQNNSIGYYRINTWMPVC